jgi:hypothetical protein
VSIQGENVADAESLLTDAGAMDVKRYVVEPEPVAAARRAATTASDRVARSRPTSFSRGAGLMPNEPTRAVPL